MAITAAMRTQVVQLYAALFGRAPEADGLGYWTTKLGNNESLNTIAQQMYSVDAARAYYPSFLTNDEIITKFYVNVLGRQPDQGGKDYYLAQLNAKGATPGSVIAQMISDVVNYKGTDADGLKSQALFNNKVSVGEYYAVTLVGNDITFAKTLFTGLTDDAATVTAKKAAADSAVNPPPVGQTLTLTISATDVPKAGGADDIIIGQIGQSTTLQASDSIDGGAGNDTLRVVTDGGTAAAVSGFTTTNVETLEVQSQATGGTTLGLENATGIKTIRSSSSNTDLTFKNVKAIAGLEIVGSLQNQNVTVEYQAAAVSGSADVQAVTLNGNNMGTLTDNGIETLAVTTSTAASTVTGIVGDKLAKVTVAGDKAFTITNALPATVTSVDASASTGGTTFTLTNAADVSVKGGSGADSFTFTGALTSGDTIDGGAGVDTITANLAEYTGSSYAVASKITNVEVLAFADALSGTFDASKFTGENTFRLNNGFNAATIDKADDASTVNVRAASTGTLTYNITNASDANTNNTVNIQVGGANGVNAGTIATAGVETVNLTSNGSAATAGGNTLTITDAAATKLTIAGAEDLTLTLTGTALTTLDASTATGKLDLSAVTYKASTSATITGGAGADTIVGSDAADVIVGGAGNDVLQGGSGADTLTGGAGADTFVFKTASDSSGSGSDTITDFVSGTDLINVQSLAASVGRTNVVLKDGAASSFGTAQSAIAQNSGNTQVVFQADTNTLWVDLNDDGTLNNNDLQIKLTGVTKIVAADIGGTATPAGTGNYPTLTAPAANLNKTTQTNASALTTDNADSVSSTYANLINSTIDGAGGTDTISVSDAITATFTFAAAGGAGATLSNFEVINLGGGSTAAVTAPNTTSLTINNSSSSSAATVVLGNVAQTYNGNGAVDTVTLGAAGQTVKTGAGNDVINGATVAFVATTTIDGGAGTDSLTFAAGQTYAAASFTGTSTSITGIETLDLGAVADAAQSVTLFDGLKTVTINTSTYNQAGVIPLTGTAARVGALTTLTNAGTNAATDVVALTVSDAATSLDLTGLTVSVTGGSGFANLTLGNFTNNVTLNGNLFNNGANNGFATITGGSGTDTLTLTDVAATTFAATANSAPASIENITLGGTAATNYTDTDASARTITGNSANNTFTIAAASAAKTVNISSGGSDTIKVDNVGTASAAVTVQGFQVGATASGGDIISLSYGGATSGLVHLTGTTGNLTANGAAAVANIINVVALDNAAFQVSGSFTDTAAKNALVNGFLNGSAALGHTTANFYYVALDNGTDTAIYRIQVTDAGGTNGLLDSVADIAAIQQVVVLTGIADVATLTAANFA